MARPVFGKMRVIVLPAIDLHGSTVTFDEYKEMTGIDLNDVFKIELSEDEINVSIPGNSLILFDTSPIGEDLGSGIGLTPLTTNSVASAWVRNSTDAVTQLGYSDIAGAEISGSYGLYLKIGNRNSFSKENIVIGKYEI